LDNFAFVIHPIDPKRDVERKFPLLGQYLPVAAIHFLSRFFPPLYISHITGVRSMTGKEVGGWFVACPLTPERMLSLPVRAVYRKVVQTGRLAQRLGARILGLGAFTLVVGDAGITIANRLAIPVTTGGSYTVAMAVQAVRAAATRMELAYARSTVAVVGAAGAVGSVSARLLGRECGSLILVGLPHHLDRLHALRSQIEGQGGCQVRVTADYAALCEAEIVVTVTSAVSAIIEPHHLRPGAVVLDVARPRNVSRRVVQERNDVLVIEGGHGRCSGGRARLWLSVAHGVCLHGRGHDPGTGRAL